MLPPTFTCPKCKCHALYRTRRGSLGLLLSLIGLWPARCYTCRKRCYVYLRKAPVKRQGENRRRPENIVETPIPKRLTLTLD